MFGLRARREHAQRAVDAVAREVERLAGLGPETLRPLAGRPPADAERDGIVLTTRVDADGDRLLVLVEAWRGRRMLATGGFAMAPDGSTHTPH
jgi:hypothetical protein